MLIRLIGAHWAICAALLINTANAQTLATGAATDAAFAALLAMPGTQPIEGGWIIPPQDKPTPEDETELIERLKALKQAGAQFDAKRHGGSLLAHAIRAGKEQTALWLLRQGARTSDVVLDGQTAHQLALQYQRTAVARVLEERYGFKVAPSVASLAVNQSKAPLTSAVSATPALSPREQARRLLAQQTHHFPNKADQQSWQTLSTQLTPADHAALFADGVLLPTLLSLMHEAEGGVETALSRLPQDLVQRHAQVVANFLARVSFVSYANGGKRTYSAVARSWPALWSRIQTPLDYSQRPDLAEHVPPELWPGLIASGYHKPHLRSTGCLLSALDANTFEALWPDIQRFFPDAGQWAPSLVLESYQLTGSCYSTTPQQTVKKLHFMRAQQVPGRLPPLSPQSLKQADEPLLALAAEPFIEQPKAPRLAPVALECQLDLDGTWVQALIDEKIGGAWPSVQAIDVPGQNQCALFFSTDTYGSWGPEVEDDFHDGPFANGRANCPDPPGHGEYWLKRDGRVQKADLGETDCGYSCLRQKVQDVQTKAIYWLNDSPGHPMCRPTDAIPFSHEWRFDQGLPKLTLNRERSSVTQHLRAQCSEADDGRAIVCKNLGAISEMQEARVASTEFDQKPPVSGPSELLRRGEMVSLSSLVDELGATRR
jgi:hypothetical protein